MAAQAARYAVAVLQPFLLLLEMLLDITRDSDAAGYHHLRPFVQSSLTGQQPHRSRDTQCRSSLYPVVG